MGMKKRLVLSMALLSNPQLIFLDEPAVGQFRKAGLDQIFIMAIMSYLSPNVRFDKMLNKANIKESFVAKMISL